MNPLVSICVPIYGVELYIKRCLISLFSQTYHNIEYIFVNDCTEDNSLNILQDTLINYPNIIDRVKIINNNINKGLAYSRLLAIQNSSGDYIFHVDSDDWISENCIEVLVSKALSEDCDLVYADYYNFFSKPIRKILIYFDDKTEYLKALISHDSKVEPVIWNRLIKREIQFKALPIPGINFSEDWATYPRIVYYAKKIGKINNHTYFYRRNNNNSYCSNLKPQYLDNLYEAWDILFKFFGNKGYEYNYSLFNSLQWLFLFTYSTGNLDFIASINSRYPNFKFKKSRLSLYHRIVLFLSDIKQYWAIRFINKYGKLIKKKLLSNNPYDILNIRIKNNFTRRWQY